MSWGIEIQCWGKINMIPKNPVEKIDIIQIIAN